MPDPRQHCCPVMTTQIMHYCAQHEDIFSCPDALIVYEPRFDEYGIIIHDGGRSSVAIRYCPWCGTALPESQRDRWFDTLEALGFDDPMTQPIPEAFTSDAWYRPPPHPASARSTA